VQTARQARPAQRKLFRTASFCGSACDQQEMWPDAEHLWHIGAAVGDIKYGVKPTGLGRCGRVHVAG
jgi:hypothetical protein